MRENDLNEAAEAFEQVIVQEREELTGHNKDDAEGGKTKYGQWSYKSMKQLVKLHLRSGNADEMMRHYNRLLECIAQGDVNPNAVEKGINGMLERFSSLYQGAGAIRNASSSTMTLDPQKLALAVYDATLKVFHPSTGACPNERLWFKTNLKYGQLLYEMNETSKLQQVLRDLKTTQQGNITSAESTSSSTSGSSTQSMEIYALQIQLYSRQKDNKKLREVFNKAMAVRGGIPHPRTLALIQELGGKMHMAAKEYEAAGKTFFQAFKSYDEAGDPSRLRCLKYLVLASMLHASSINPFDSQEARPYRDDPEITAMTNLVQAFHNNEIQKFERILRQNTGRIMEDEFVREHVEDLLRTIRTQVLRRVIRPYTRISLSAVAKELNDIPVADVENLLVSLILDGMVDGQIDQVSGVLLKKAERGPALANDGSNSNMSTQAGRAAMAPTEDDLTAQKYEAMNQLATALDGIAVSVTSARMKEGPSMRGMVH
jgi:COP9 signalosome complex subunit 2